MRVSRLLGVATIVMALTLSSVALSGPARADTNQPSGKFCLYRDTQPPVGWWGPHVCFDAGNRDRLPSGWNDQTSSLVNNTATTLCVYEHTYRRGYRLVVGAGHYFRNLTKDITPGGNTWNDRISSFGYCS
jgi:hypothetical protein